MTDRDFKVLDFINLVGICRTIHLKKLFFNDCSNTVLNRRTSKLAEYGELKRFRCDIFDREYVYYNDKKPNQRILRHDLYITDLVLALLNMGVEIISLDRNVVIDNVISDAFIVTRYNNLKRSFLVEVQLSGKLSDCTDKYKNLDTIKNFMESQNLNTLPKLLVISDLKGPIKTKLKYYHINCSLDSVQECFL